MNIGYGKFSKEWKKINDSVCPICGKNIYVAKRGHDFACEDINCPLGHGASKIFEKETEIKQILFWISIAE